MDAGPAAPPVFYVREVAAIRSVSKTDYHGSSPGARAKLILFDMTEYLSKFPDKPTHCQFKDLEGQRFGRLTVVAFGGLQPGRQSKAVWICRCDCGRWRTVLGASLRIGQTVGCGCVRIASITRHGHTTSKNGLRASTRVYNIWTGVKRRCLNPDDPAYHNYGGRGIALSPRWMDFRCFYADMGDPPTRKHTLDRIDNDGNYEPGNCRWATMKEQLQNTRRNRWVEFSGRRQTLTAWSEEIGISFQCLAGRLDKGWPVELALTAPPMPQGGNRRWHNPMVS